MATVFLWYLSFLVYPAYVCWSLDFVMFYLCSFTVIKASHALRFWAQWAKFLLIIFVVKVINVKGFSMRQVLPEKKHMITWKACLIITESYLGKGRGEVTYFHSYSKNCLHFFVILNWNKMYSKRSDVSGSEQCIFA